MLLKKNGSVVGGYEPTYAGKKIAIAIDSSKTNTAMIVGDIYGNVLDDYELNGKSDTDVLLLCKQEREALKLLFEGAKIQLVGIEDIITKKHDKNQNPMDIHMSRFKITAVFMSLICFFQDTHKITPELVNNQHWKSEVLPEEYCKRTHKKGSLDYMKDIGSKYATRSDDITDAYCIYQFLAREHGYKDITEIEEPCAANKAYHCGLFPLDTGIPPKAKQFVYNPNLTFKQNCDTMIYHMGMSDEFAFAKVNVSDLTIEEIYENASGARHKKFEKEVYVFCKVTKD